MKLVIEIAPEELEALRMAARKEYDAQQDRLWKEYRPEVRAAVSALMDDLWGALEALDEPEELDI